MSKKKETKNILPTHIHFIDFNRSLPIEGSEASIGNRDFKNECWDKYFNRGANSIKQKLNIIFYQKDISVKIKDIHLLSELIPLMEDTVEYSIVEKNNIITYIFTFKSIMARMFFMRILRAYSYTIGREWIKESINYMESSRTNIYTSLLILNDYYNLVKYNVGLIKKHKFSSYCNEFKLLPTVIHHIQWYYKENYREGRNYILPIIKIYNKKSIIDNLNSKNVYHTNQIAINGNNITGISSYYQLYDINNKTKEFTRKQITNKNLYFEIQKIFENIMNMKKLDVKEFVKHYKKLSKLKIN